MTNRKTISILQISLMVIAIFAFSFILNSAFVSASDDASNNPPSSSLDVGKDCLALGGSCTSSPCPGTLSKLDCWSGTLCCLPAAEPLDKAGFSTKSGDILQSLTALPGTIKTTKELLEKDKLTEEAAKKVAEAEKGQKTFLRSIGRLFMKEGSLTIAGSITAVVAISAAAFAVGRLLGPALGLDLSGSQALGWALAGGSLAGMVAGNAFNMVGGAFLGPLASTGLGAAVAVIIFALTYKKTPVEVVQFQCLGWQPQSGGEFCDECNNGDLPCTEYQCKSLGASCELINQGTTEEMCYYSNRTDVKPPIIDVNDARYDSNEILLKRFEENNERGVNLLNKDNPQTGCYSPFEPIDIAITLDEPGICKYSLFRDDSYEEMPNSYFSNGVARYNHSTSFNLPGRDAIEAENLTFFEGLNNVFIRCEDPNGNTNVDNYVFDFCVDETPDLTEPIVLATNPISGSYLSFNTLEVESTFYIDKPSECRWDHFDLAYDDMANTMSCTESIGDGVPLNQRIVYPCTTTLTGIQNYEPNNFYISCKSYPGKEEAERMEMGQSYEYTLIGTRPLGIESIEPNGTTMVDSADAIKVLLEVVTIEGALEDGTATCQYSLSGNDNDLITFFETNSYYHSQELYLVEGDYNIRIKCTDLGGNVAEDYAKFTVDIDTEPPLVARAYYENNKIVLVTTENATCTYNTKSCDQSYEDSIEITRSDNVNHYLAWDTEQNLYIKCEDEFGNRPGPGVCNIIVRGHELFQSSDE